MISSTWDACARINRAIDYLTSVVINFDFFFLELYHRFVFRLVGEQCNSKSPVDANYMNIYTYEYL